MSDDEVRDGELEDRDVDAPVNIDEEDLGEDAVVVDDALIEDGVYADEEEEEDDDIDIDDYDEDKTEF